MSDPFGEFVFDFPVLDLAAMGIEDVKTKPTAKIVGCAGYEIGDRALTGRALLTSMSAGVNLIYRLKDTRPILFGEIQFWGAQMARMVDDTARFDAVTFAPSSGKRPENKYLARMLATSVAEALNLPLVACFQNIHQRGNRGGAIAKLHELHDNPYQWIGNGVKSVLVVDDVVYTRSTALRCKYAAAGAGVETHFLILYRN